MRLHGSYAGFSRGVVQIATEVSVTHELVLDYSHVYLWGGNWEGRCPMHPVLAMGPLTDSGLLALSSYPKTAHLGPEKRKY